MAVSPSQTAAHMIRRVEERERRDRERALAARDVAGRVAAVLADRFGATRVLLFGSLVRGGFGERSDIDLAVDGIAASDLPGARDALAALAEPFDVDLLSLEEIPTSWRERILREGEALR